jgi:hypothetical protein
MRFQMVMGLIVILFHGGVFERAVHAFHLAIGPGMVSFREAMLDAKLLADALRRGLPYGGLRRSGTSSRPAPIVILAKEIEIKVIGGCDDSSFRKLTMPPP